jgi:hypothetical protein
LMYPRLTWNSKSCCFNLPSAKITGIYYHYTWPQN